VLKSGVNIFVLKLGVKLPCVDSPNVTILVNEKSEERHNVFEFNENNPWSIELCTSQVM